MSPASKLAPVVFAVSLAVCASVRADDYRAEVRLTGEHVEFDDAFGARDADILQVGGTYYLEPVKTDGLPLAEAAFLNRSSFVNGGASHVAVDDGDDLDAFGASLGYYLPETIFFGRLGVTRQDFGSGSDTQWNGTFGVTPIDGLLLSTDFDEDGWDPNVRAKYVGKMANGHFYAATVRAVDPDQGDINVGIDFDYFIDLTFKVGAGYNDGGDRFTARAEKFFTPRFAVGGSVYTDEGGDGFGVQVAWRF